MKNILKNTLLSPADHLKSESLGVGSYYLYFFKIPTPQASDDSQHMLWILKSKTYTLYFIFHIDFISISEKHHEIGKGDVTDAEKQMNL